MFSKISRSFLMAVLTCLASLAIKSQTLYWIGGSGNFNDPKHWSLSPGGVSSNTIIPNFKTKVIFNSIEDLYVAFNKPTSVNSIIFEGGKKYVFSPSAANVSLNVAKDLISKKTTIELALEIPLNFSSALVKDTGTLKIQNLNSTSDIKFLKGSWEIHNTGLLHSNNLAFSNSTLKFKNSIFFANNLVFGNSLTVSAYSTSWFSKDQKYTNDSKWINSENSFINDKSVSGNVTNGGVQSSSKVIGLGSNQTNVSFCSPTFSVVKPSCAPGCDGKIILTIPSFTNPCWAPSTPTSVYVSVATGTCTGVTGLSNVSPGTYTLSNVCNCGNDYVLLLFDHTFPAGTSFLESINVPVTQPVINSFVASSSPILCNGACTGNLNLVWIGGVSPYSYTVGIPTQAPITFTSASSSISQSSICAGTVTLIARDALQCFGNQTVFFSQPSAILSSTGVNSITCNGACNGSVSITPSGGTPNYTVNFSNSTSFNTSPGVPVNSGTLCAGPLTATITDMNSCKLVVGPLAINEPTAALAVVLSTVGLSCNSVCNGSASALVTGGTPPYSYTWTSNVSTGSTAVGYCASIATESLTVKDINNCSNSSQTFSITQPPPITAIPSQTNVLCNGAASGAASLTMSGGTGAYSFTWTAPGPATLIPNSPSQTGLLSYAAPYTVTIKDANSCTITPILFTITQPPAVTLAIVSKSVDCFNGSNGGATVTATGGNPGYTYSWTPGASTNSAIASLTAGIYQVLVVDANACFKTQTVSILQPTAGISPVTTFSSQSCNTVHTGGVCNGTIFANPTGGTLPYTYTLQGAASSFTAPPYSGLCSGNYTLIVGSSAGQCTVQSAMTLTTPSALNPVININTPIACHGTSVGGLTGSPGSGGTPTYALTWVAPTGTIPGNPTSISSLTAGVYTMIVTDLKGCSTSTSIALTQPSSITIVVATSSILCFSGNNGVITSTTSGGSPGYSFAWTNSLSVNVGSTSTASNLAPGPYTLTVIDASLCPRTQTANIVSPPPITLTALTSAVKCFGGSNGSVTLTASGGVTPYNPTFTITTTGFTTTTSGSSSILSAGNYTATMKDFNGCVQTKTFVITQPAAALSAAITGSGSCNVCSGTAVVTPTNGTGPYFVLWTSSISGTFVSISPTISSLCPANYSVTVTDFEGCTTSTNIAINQVINISINPGANSILCNGANTGSATSSPSGGIAPYTYSWTVTPTTQTNQILTGVVAGTYTVRVTDSSVPACSHTAAITISQPPAMILNTSSTNVTCFSFSNGAVGVNVSGGTPGSGTPYTYTWTPTGLFTSSLSGIPANSYTVNIRDGNLCPTSTVITITESPSISIAITKTNPTGCTSALANGSICATASGGTGAGYSYTLTGPSTNSSNTSGCFTGLGAGTYSIVVTDGALCSGSTNTTLTVPLSPTVTVSSTAVACFGFSTGVASATATGATPTLAIAWTPTVVFTQNGTGSLTSASNLPAGIYFISATDGFGCVTSQPVTVTTAPAIVINGNSTNLLCNSISTGSIAVAPTGGTPGSPSYTYAWVPPSGTISAGQGQGTASVTALSAGIYTLNLLDANLCSTPHTFTITQPPAITLTAITSSILCNSNCTGSIVVNAGGGTGSLNYSWTPIGGNTSTIIGLCANGTGTNPASYTLSVSDQNTCSIITTYTITQPSALTSTIGIVGASCSNSCNAVATNSSSGGAGTYSYSWNTSTVSTSSLGALCSGTYIASVTDLNGCVTPTQFTVTPPAPLSVTLTPVNPLCNNACDGSITTLVSGAQGLVSYSWSPAGTGQSPSGLCATPNPIYTLVAIDQNSCEVTAVATLTNPPALLASVSPTNPLCHDDTNGMATVSFTNAVGATSYNWVPTGPPTQTAQTATGLASGSYTVIVTDDNLCQANVSFSITNPSTISPNPSIGASACSNSVGNIILNPTGGTPGSPTPYTYTWTGVTSSAVSVFSLYAGQYTVQIADGVGCITSTVLTVSDSNGPNVIPIISTNIICNAQCTGAATIDVTNVSGGSTPYIADWTSPSSTAAAVGNLCAGNYNARITDVNGCQGFTTVTISEPPPIVNAPSIGLPLCAGVCDGTIALNTSGGNAPYTYTWAPIASNSPSLTNLCSGDYTVYVGYNAVCSESAIISIPVQTSINIVPTLTNNLCFGNCNGAIDLTLSGGTSPYSVSWSNSQTTPFINGLCNGTYSASVIDASGCLSIQAATISSGSQITTSTSAFSPSCGLCNGTASVSVSGGVSPFTYNWSNAATSAAVSSLCAGVYQVIITDNNLCSQTETVIINNSNGITGETINTQQIPCSGTCVGAATVAAIGGNPPIAYNWINPATTNSVISNLCPGTYFVQMVDAQNCIRTASVNIDPLVTLSVSAFLQLPACGNNTAGVISLVISGGTPSYAIAWNPPAGNSTTLTGLGAGVYSYTITESSTNSCSISNAINFSNSNGPILSAIQRDVDCFGANTGSISTSVTSSSTPLSYAWSTIPVSTLSSVSGLGQGVITLTVTDVNSCKTIQSFTISENPAFNLGSTNVQNPVCFGDCDGSITLIANGGVLPYNYLWSVASATNNPLTGLCDGTYSVTITDALGCPLSNSNAATSYTIKSTSSITLSANTINTSCSSVADGSISITPGGGVAEYSYLWNGPSNYSATSQNINGVYEGSYTVTVTDNLNCKRDSSFLIIPTLTVVADAGPNSIICPETGSVVLNAQGSGGTISYKWYMYPDTINSVSSQPTYTVAKLIEPEIYKLVITSAVPSCFATDVVKVDLYYAPTINMTNFYQIPIYTEVTLGGEPTTQSGNTLTWTPAFSLSDANAFNPIASNTVNTTFTLTVTDQNGCTAMDTVQVLLYPEITITNGFTPNGDGKNDVWKIDYLDQFPDCTVEIYNRWGDRLFASTGYYTPFDGRYKGQELPVGTYYYIININHPGYPKPITGPLTIFR